MAAESQTVELKVAMSCGGCSGAVKRVLTKMQGVETFDIDMEQQKVTVKGNVTPEDVFQTVSKTGKKTSFWEAEATPVQAAAPAAEAPAVADATEAPAAVAATEAPAAAAATEAPPANTDA
ncbi:copper transport protein ATX1-like [Lolium rigidum]|uniref:copper transport protein ATX1-like n=1 Tax=Lolium rigidum TaxID=89674 RepID=UPI001F5DA2EC|nr:copper transport protein ATX1-like [Lolium rigidum]